ncbi:MAG: hypothetical protein J5605_03025 [Bacteroidales bacterium]|nr:hypothetical protein [Bacteroidales bacterium]
MTAVQQNVMHTELWQSIGAIADNETLMQRLTRYAKKKLANEKTDITLFSEEDFLTEWRKLEKSTMKENTIPFTVLRSWTNISVVYELQSTLC